MSHSNSSLNCFANCMAKYEHVHILHTEPCKPISPHLTFGVMAHDVLHKAGLLRDEVADGVVDKEQYRSIIPSEVLYPELKETFGINSWENYFRPIIKQVAQYEREHVQSLIDSKTGDVNIMREVKLQLTVEQLKSMGYNNIKQPVVGIIDLLIMTKTKCIICDYKFSTTKKTQDDFDMNSQLQLYACLVNLLYDIPLHNIQYGYIDIPKTESEKPIILSSGKLSRSKTQNVTQEMYGKAVEAIHGDDPYYNCKPGGYYYDCWCNMALNKPAYETVQYLDYDTYFGVLEDLLDAAAMIDFMIDNKMTFLKKYDAYSCKSCEYVRACKPWLNVNGE